MPARLTFVTALLVVGLLCQETLAQRTSSGTTSGAFGSRTLGSSLSAGTRTFSSAGGGSGGVGSAGNFGVGTAGAVDSGDRFVRTSRQAGAFVGADSADAREFVGNVAAGAAGNSSRNIRRGGGGAANANQGGGRGRQNEDIRISLNVGFLSPPVTVDTSLAASKLAGRMQRSSWIQNRSPLEVELAQGIATLRGVVATEHDRVLAERLALLEPGISSVRNELMVQPPDSPPAPVRFVPGENTSPE